MSEKLSQMMAWVCWRASQFDTAQICRHEGCGWATILNQAYLDVLAEASGEVRDA